MGNAGFISSTVAPGFLEVVLSLLLSLSGSLMAALLSGSASPVVQDVEGRRFHTLFGHLLCANVTTGSHVRKKGEEEEPHEHAQEEEAGVWTGRALQHISCKGPRTIWVQSTGLNLRRVLSSSLTGSRCTILDNFLILCRRHQDAV